MLNKVVNLSKGVGSDEFDDGDITKKYFVEIILQIELKRTEAQHVVEKKGETEEEEVNHDRRTI